MGHLQLVTPRGNKASPGPGEVPPAPARDSGGEVLPFGLAGIDNHLPGGGLDRKAVHEFLPASYNDRAAAFGLMAGLLAGFQQHSAGPLLVCDLMPKVGERLTLYGPGLMARGLDPARLIYLRLRSEADFLWALEEGLSCDGLAGVAGLMGMEKNYGFTESKRLSLRARERGRPLFLLRPHGAGGATAAKSRWRISARPSLPDAHPNHYLPGLGDPRWRLELVRAPGASPAHWEIGWSHETHHFHMAQGLGGRALPPPGEGESLRATGVSGS